MYSFTIFANNLQFDYCLSQKISLKLWLILFSIILLFGLLSTASSFLYLLDTNNPAGFFELLQSRILSYLLWIVFIPVIYSFTSFLLQKNIKIIGIITLIFVGVIISAIHRITVVYSNDILFADHPSQDFFDELLSQKFAVLSLIYESFFLFTLLVILITIYMYNYISREAKLSESKYRTQLVSAELSNLKMKFQPHFIFNALHSISAMLYLDPSKADTMITKLSGLLRYAVKTGDTNFVLLSEELEIADKYFEIQKLRFGERIKYLKEIDEIALQAKVPIFILQPLLENCIKHAVELTSDTVSIRNEINLFDDELSIKIINTIPNNKKEISESFGEGLQNLASRLEFLYKKDYSFSANKISVDEFEVIIKLPVGNGKEN